MMVRPPTFLLSPGTVSSQFPPASEARSTTTEPVRIASTISLVISLGAGRPGMSAVVITTSMSGTTLRNSPSCAFL